MSSNNTVLLHGDEVSIDCWASWRDISCGVKRWEPCRVHRACGATLQAFDRAGWTFVLFDLPMTFVSDVIELRELRVQAVVGVLSEERDRAQPLALDIDIARPFEEASINDDLAETTNYADVLQIATKVATEAPSCCSKRWPTASPARSSRMTSGSPR